MTPFVTLHSKQVLDSLRDGPQAHVRLPGRSELLFSCYANVIVRMGVVRQCFSPSLKTLRRRRRLPLYVIVVWYVATAIAVVGASLLWFDERIVAVAGCSGPIFIIAAVLFKARTRCPRCGAGFFGSWLFYWPFARSCLHCGCSVFAQWVYGKHEYHQLREWVLGKEGGRPMPDIGLHCPRCEYRLAGLKSERCPECGMTFELERLLSDTEFVCPNAVGSNGVRQ